MDLYSTLGVDRNAQPDIIKKAYRKLAAQHHPDRGGDTKKFQEIQHAYDVLSDPIKKQEYDNPAPKVNNMFNQDFGHQFFDDFLRNFHGHNPNRQRVYTVTMFVTLEQVARGSTENVNINTPLGNKWIQVRIPQGLEDGQQYRFDVLQPEAILNIVFRINPHPLFDRRGLDLYTKHKVSFFDLILGTKILVKDILNNELEITIPPMTKPDTTLRVPRKGLQTQNNIGDQYILIQGELPSKISQDLVEAIKLETMAKGINSEQ